MDELLKSRVLQIKRAHLNARPTHENPPWVHCERDIAFLLNVIEAQERELTAVAGLARNIVRRIERSAIDAN